MDRTRLYRTTLIAAVFAVGKLGLITDNVYAGLNDPPAPPVIVESGAFPVPQNDISFEDAIDLSTSSMSGRAGGVCSEYSDCGGCGSCNDCSGGWMLRGIQPTDCCFSQFISPITGAIFFEDPRTLTEARFVFANHKFPGALGAGDAQLYALQLRAALNDRLSLIVIKGGFLVGQPDAPHDDGWTDVNAGLKYLLWSDCCGTRLLSAGATYEAPLGSSSALQGNGDGEFNVFLSGAAELGRGWLWMSTLGARLPSDTNQESQSAYWSNHFSHRLGCSNWYGVAEVHWYHWMRSGGQTAFTGIEGLDLYNFGSTGVAGNDIVTGAVGVRYKPSCRTELGLAWQAPLTDRRDILDNRVTIDWIWRY